LIILMRPCRNCLHFWESFNAIFLFKVFNDLFILFLFNFRVTMKVRLSSMASPTPTTSLDVSTWLSQLLPARVMMSSKENNSIKQFQCKTFHHLFHNNSMQYKRLTHFCNKIDFSKAINCFFTSLNWGYYWYK